MTATLPTGYLKRLELARCLALKPELIICDEVFSGLSMSEIASMVPLIERLQMDGITLIMIEHRLRELFNEHAPCLILVDEWVAYARQLHDLSDLPAGGFETQFSFAQSLTEAAKAAKQDFIGYDGACRDLTPEQQQAFKKAVMEQVRI